jgi:hypothetical protein
VRHSRDEIGQRLAGAGAGLDQEMLVLGDRIGHCVHHLDLPGTLDPTDPLHRGVQECVKVRGFRGHWLRL